MILNKQLVEFNGELYWVYRKVKVEQVKDAATLKDFWSCDIAFRPLPPPNPRRPRLTLGSLQKLPGRDHPASSPQTDRAEIAIFD